MTWLRTSMAAFSWLTILGLASTAAFAQAAPEDDSGLRQNCVGDYFRFCSSYMPGSTEIRRCFATNTDKLTADCRNAIRAFDRRNGNRS